MKRIFLDWNEPAVTAAARNLLFLDGSSLSQSLLIVPTKASSFKLQRELVRLSQQGAVLLPEITTAESLIATCVEQGRPQDTNIASSCVSLAAWANTLMKIDLARFPTLFGKLKVERNFAWACSCAEQFIRTRNSLAEGEWDFANIARRLQEKNPQLKALLPAHEYKRWQELALLEKEVAQLLASWGKEDFIPFSRRILKSAPVPVQGRIILLCHPDPQPVLTSLLEQWEAQGADVQVWIHAPDDFAPSFDSVGRPLSDAPFVQKIPLPGGNECLDVTETPEGVAEKTLAHISRNKISNTSLAIGVCDPDFTPALTDAFHAQGWIAYDAAGYSPARTSWKRIIQLLREAVLSPDRLAPVWELASLPVIQQALGMAAPYDLSLALDKIRAQHLPETIEYTRRLLPDSCRDDFALLEEWLLSWAPGHICKQLHDLVDRARATSPHMEPALLDALQKSVEALSSLEADHRLDSVDDLFLLLEKSFLAQTLYENPVLSHVSLENWLELSFCHEPNLILTTMHEGVVPENEFADPLLPDKVRRILGLRSNESRKIRDAYLLNSLIKSRETQGSLRIIISKYGPQGSPCLPSSLLLCCSPQELPERVKKLFPTDAPPRRLPSYDRGDWVLTTPAEENPWKREEKAFSPSRLKEFLSCPLRFWLKHMGGFDRLELDVSAQAYQMGNIIHNAMEALKEPDLIDCANAAKVGAKLQEVFSQKFNDEFGDSRSLPLSVQYEFGLDRMLSVGRVHTEQVAQGWRIIETEKAVNGWELMPGRKLNMRLDCLQRNELGEIRILDYKTSKKAKYPQDAHLKKLSSRQQDILSEYFPELEPLLLGGDSKKTGQYRWLDLQLPLYLLWAQSAFPGHTIHVGYFNIPLNLDATGISPWAALDQDFLTNARDWALAIMGILREGDFTRFPSAETLGWTTYQNDPFFKLGSDGLEKAFNLSHGKEIL